MILPRLGNSKTMKGISIIGVCALATIGLAVFRGFNPEFEPQDMLGKTDSELEAMLDPLAEDLAMDRSRRALREYRASKGFFSCDFDCVDNRHRYLTAERELRTAKQRRINARIAQRLRLRGIVPVILTQAEKEAAATALREARLADRTPVILTQAEKEAAATALREARLADRTNNGFNLLSSEERHAARKAERKEEQAVLSRAHWAERARLEVEAARLAAIRQAIFDRNQERPCPADYTKRSYNGLTQSYEGEDSYTEEENPAYYGIYHACWFQQVHADKAVVNAAMQAARRSEGFGNAKEMYVAVEGNVMQGCSPGKDIDQSACFAAAFEFRGRLFSTLQVDEEGGYCGCYYNNYSGFVSYGTGSYEAGTCGDNTREFTTFICNPGEAKTVQELLEEEHPRTGLYQIISGYDDYQCPEGLEVEEEDCALAALEMNDYNIIGASLSPTETSHYNPCGCYFSLSKARYETTCTYAANRGRSYHSKKIVCKKEP